ncbi:hypothetical protein G3N55_06335 [Dissulfurirhabdus thermomarina]|uniref:FeoB-associated Cys-rich membrane protein n=1 Tax=Dissulfurirhabdus thermomarina TaxID=1765737 RepID=A0A6N9TMU9_DISTH|nr:hypothetical protein [Dissulfurirhabdus thermomarina]NDY42459.1 hypothetical protein [Dissulfurirhabdus thermomarina]NMX23847.1 hypothetical protein [Dissulfurirhabdus thermomarina]
MWQEVVVWTLFGLCAAWLAVRIYRSLRGGACGCADSCQGCTYAGHPEGDDAPQCPGPGGGPSPPDA